MSFHGDVIRHASVPSLKAAVRELDLHKLRSPLYNDRQAAVRELDLQKLRTPLNSNHRPAIPELDLQKLRASSNSDHQAAVRDLNLQKLRGRSPNSDKVISRELEGLKRSIEQRSVSREPQTQKQALEQCQDVTDKKLLKSTLVVRLQSPTQTSADGASAIDPSNLEVPDTLNTIDANSSEAPSGATASVPNDSTALDDARLELRRLFSSSTNPRQSSPVSGDAK